MASVRHQLAEQDAEALEVGSAILLHVEVTPSMLIARGIDLENTQRKLRADTIALRQHATDEQRGRIVIHGNTLQRQIDAWFAVHALYFPATVVLRTREDKRTVNPGGEDAFCLYLPSDICDHICCDQNMMVVEWELCAAEADDALNECRHHIRIRAQLLKFKDHNLHGQGTNTRARKSLRTLKERLSLSHAKYSRARTALLKLSDRLGKVGWQRKYQPLKMTDLRPIGDLLDGETHGTAVMSWIWRTTGLPADDDTSLQDSLRIEWTKAWARYNHWDEEVLLLLEEMRRVLAFLKWEAQVWDNWAISQTFHRDDDAEGFVAYACRQASIKRDLFDLFSQRWAGLHNTEATDLPADRIEDEPTIDAPPNLHLEDIGPEDLGTY